MKRTWSFLFYLVYFAAGSAFFPYIALYYKSIGLTGGQIGLLTGLAPLLTLIGAPFWTGIADASGRHKLILSLTLIGTIIAVVLIPTFTKFSLLLPFVLLYCFISAPIIALGDSATLSMLGEERHLYGRIRIGGTIGWGVMAYFAGLLIEANGIIWAYWLYAAGMAITLIISQGLVFDKIAATSSFWGGVKDLLAQRHWLIFLATALICGIGTASINTYQFVYLQELGASKTSMGLSLTISTLSELPVMFFGSSLLTRFKAQGLLRLGMIAISLRVLLYAAFNFPSAILLFQLLHGFTFPIIWIAGVSYAHANAPDGLRSTAQGLFGAMLMGFGVGVGSFLGGILIDAFGGRVMYLIFGLIVLLGLLLNLFLARAEDAHV